MERIEFPGLWGLGFTISRTAFQVFGINIYWYGIIIALAFLLAVLLGMRDSRKFGLEPDNIIDLVIFAAPAAIICARLYYVVFSWDQFKDNPLEIINTRTGGLAIYGAVIGAVLVAYLFARKKKIPVLKLFDFAAPYLVLAQAIGRWGNFVNQEAFGVNTTLPWGMTGDGIRRELVRSMDTLNARGVVVDPNMPVHPTFLYESLWNLCIFLFLMWYRKRKKVEGEVFFLYMILYGLGRFMIEGLRIDSLMLGNIRISQILALLFALGFAAAFYRLRRKSSEAEEEAVAVPSKYGDILKNLQNEEGIPAEVKTPIPAEIPAEPDSDGAEAMQHDQPVEQAGPETAEQEACPEDTDRT